MNKKSQLLVCGPATRTIDSFGTSPTKFKRESHRNSRAKAFFIIIGDYPHLWATVGIDHPVAAHQSSNVSRSQVVRMRSGSTPRSPSRS